MIQLIKSSVLYKPPQTPINHPKKMQNKQLPYGAACSIIYANIILLQLKRELFDFFEYIRKQEHLTESRRFPIKR